jgi:hypothetical protein
MEMKSIEYREYAASKRAEASELEAKYSGARPGWVSTDIAMALDSARLNDAEADRLEALENETKKEG